MKAISTSRAMTDDFLDMDFFAADILFVLLLPVVGGKKRILFQNWQIGRRRNRLIVEKKKSTSRVVRLLCISSTNLISTYRNLQCKLQINIHFHSTKLYDHFLENVYLNFIAFSQIH